MTDIPRDRFGRPLIKDPDSGKLVAYNRTSSFGEVLDDHYHINRWRNRTILTGAALHPVLLARTIMAVTTGNKSHLNALLDELFVAGGGEEKAKKGTELHSLTEDLDRGVGLDDLFVSPEDAASLRAYLDATGRFEMVHIERFMVCDELKIAGTPDRLMRDGGTGPLLVGDLKTGASADFLGHHAVQLSIYAHSVLYEPETGERTPVDIDPGLGFTFHMPVGAGRCDLFEMDLEAGWEGAQLAADVRNWRKRKGLAVAA